MNSITKWLMYLVMTLLACTLCLASYKLDRAEKEINVLYLRCSELEYRSFRVDEIQGMVYYLRDGLRQYLAYQALHNSGTSAHINNLWMGLSENAQLLGWCCEDKLLDSRQGSEEAKEPVEIEVLVEDRGPVKDDPRDSAFYH